MASPDSDIYEFDAFRVDTVEKTLRKGGALIAITPTVFETLLVFLQRPSRLIEKDELMQQLWQDRFVEESNLTFNIKMLRKALGDDAQKPIFLETIPKRGYRFIVEVKRFNSKANDSLPDTSPLPKESFFSLGLRAIGNPVLGLHQDTPPAGASISPESATSAKRRFGYLGLVFAAFLLGAIGLGYYFLAAGPNNLALSRSTTIAVLPIRPINSTVRNEDYEIGIAASMINRINSIEGLFARPVNAMRVYLDLEQDPMIAGREQKVDFVLASTYQLSGETIRISWQLIDVASAISEEAYTTERGAKDIFAMQDAFAAELGDRLTTRFDLDPAGSVATRGTNSGEAYRLYLQGMYLYDRRTLEDAQMAVRKLQSATELDQNYAQAWAGMAHAYRSIGNFGGSYSPHEAYTKSIESIGRALALDPNLSDAHSALCENKFFYEYDFAGAERACRRAIELDPKSYLAHEVYSRCLWTLSRFDEAIAEVELAIDLQPTALFTQRNYAITLFYARRQSEALRQFNRVSEMDPTFKALYAWFIPALLVSGQEQQAFDWFIKWQTLMNANESTIRNYKNQFRSVGWKGVGRERVKAFDEDKIRSYFLEACLMVHIGEKDKAFEYLFKSYERREWGIPFLRIDPSLDSIRDDPRFDALLRKVQVHPGGQIVFESARN